MYEVANKIAVKILKNAEGCCLVAYPDPASPLYKALSDHGMLKKYMAGQITFDSLPDNFKALRGTPWTCGYGNTKNVTPKTVYTQAQADELLAEHVAEFMAGVIKACPKLDTLSSEKLAACTSLAYNIGLPAFGSSTVVKEINNGHYQLAADAIKMWNKAGGLINQGLVNRRLVEYNLFISV